MKLKYPKIRSRNLAQEHSDSSQTSAAKLDSVLETKPTSIVTVKVEDKSSVINIREQPTTQSKKVGEAKDGDTFEFVSLDSDWYEVRLTDGSIGFILSEYIIEYQNNN